MDTENTDYSKGNTTGNTYEKFAECIALYIFKMYGRTVFIWIECKTFCTLFVNVKLCFLLHNLFLVSMYLQNALHCIFFFSLSEMVFLIGRYLCEFCNQLIYTHLCCQKHAGN